MQKAEPMVLSPPATDEQSVYTRYCAAPRPNHPIGEPRIVHALLVATWLGRLIDPFPHRFPTARRRA